MNLERELTQLLNKYSEDNAAQTPDFLLAKFLLACLRSFASAIGERELWFGRGKWNPGADPAEQRVSAERERIRRSLLAEAESYRHELDEMSPDEVASMGNELLAARNVLRDFAHRLESEKRDA